jgi:DNA-binding beta-propeller fold protein YncE
MAPNAKKLDLLYVSDYETNDVYAYSYPQGKLSGVLAGILKKFVLPTGLCADNAGDVFIPDSSNSTVLEYPHGSTHLRKTLLDPGEMPYTCSVDPVTGDLAVVNLESVSGAGGVSIYAHGRGRPDELKYGFFYRFYFDGYDDKGNLFVDASYDVPSQPFGFAEVPKGGKSLEAIALNQSFHMPGGVGWDGKHVVVADAKSAVLYRFTITGSSGTKVGSTRLRGARSLAQFIIDSGEVVGANFNGASVGFWQYPAGGMPAKTIGGLGEPFGVTLSKASKLN